MGCSLTDPVGCLTSLAGGAAGSIADSAFSDIAKDFADAAGSAVTWLWNQISGATAISLTGPAFGKDLAIVSTLAVVVATGLFVIQVIASVLRRDGSGLTRALKGLLIAFVGSVAAIATTTLLLAAVDSLSAGFVSVATGDSISTMGTAILSATAISAVVNPAIALLLSLVVLGAVIFVWGAMMVRKLLIIVAAVFAPLAFAGATSDISTSWVRKWIETMVALVISKLILVIIFVIGLGVLTGGLGEVNGTGGGASATQSITQTIVGVLILLMAGFAPWLAIKLVHFGGEHFGQIHGHAQSALAGAQTVAAAPRKAQSLAGGVARVRDRLDPALRLAREVAPAVLGRGQSGSVSAGTSSGLPWSGSGSGARAHLRRWHRGHLRSRRGRIGRRRWGSGRGGRGGQDGGGQRDRPHCRRVVPSRANAARRRPAHARGSHRPVSECSMSRCTRKSVGRKERSHDGIRLRLKGPRRCVSVSARPADCCSGSPPPAVSGRDRHLCRGAGAGGGRWDRPGGQWIGVGAPPRRHLCQLARRGSVRVGPGARTLDGAQGGPTERVPSQSVGAPSGGNHGPPR